MNYIFNSDLYLNYSNHIFEKAEVDQDIEDEEDEETIPEPTPKKKPVVQKPPVQKPEPELDPNSDLDMDSEIDPAETDEATFSEKKQQFQKYLLYYKLRQLEYRLNDHKVLQTYKNTLDMKEFLLVLNTFLKFYNAFNYKEASNLATNILIQFKKIK